METLHTKINSLNKNFKSNAVVSSIVNVLILLLVLVFFSIGFDLTKKLLFDFIKLSWASIFPTVLDLLTVAGLILTLKKFSNILNSPDFFLHLEDKDINKDTTNTTVENHPQIVQFLNNSTLGKLVSVIWCLISLFIINFVFNFILEAANDQFSPLNEWYLLSSNFTHLPIFPINLMCIIVLIGVVLPTVLNYAKYKLEIAEVSNLHPTKTIKKEIIKEQVTEIKIYRFFIFLGLSVMCVVFSIMQRENVWFFQYNQPINEQSVLSEKLSGKSSAFCEDDLSFKTVHNQNVMTVKVLDTSEFTRETTTSYYNYAITPELKQSIQSMCEKRAQENKKIREEKQKQLDKEFEKEQKGKK